MAFHLDIRTKIIMLLFTNFLLLTHLPPVYEWVIMICLSSCFFFEGNGRSATKYLIIFTLLFLLEKDIISFDTKNSPLVMFAVGGRLLLPCFMIGSNILQGSVHEFIVCLRKWYIPEGLLLAVAVMMRFLPTLKEDYKHIRNALKTRGIFLSAGDSILKPLSFFEYITIPLLMNATRTAQDLTVTSLTKSANSSMKKTSYIVYNLTWIDYFVYFTMANIFLFYILGVGK